MRVSDFDPKRTFDHRDQSRCRPWERRASMAIVSQRLLAGLIALGALILGDGAKGRQSDKTVQTLSDEQKLDLAARELPQRFGQPTIKDLEAAEAEVRRAFLSDGIGRFIASVTFARTKGESPHVIIKLPVAAVQREELRGLVPANVWIEVISQSHNFDRSLVPLPAPPSDDIVLCTHGWGAYVEAADKPSNEALATIRRKLGNACEDELAFPYAWWLAQQAIDVLPACKQVAPDKHRNAAAVVAACGKLSGDRLAAAEVLNTVSASSFEKPNDEDTTSTLRTFFFDDARLIWSGQQAPADGVIAFWLHKMRDGHNTMLWVDQITGRDVDHVHLQGRIEGYRDVGEDRVLFSAPVRQEWVRDRPFGFRVKDIAVGQAVPAERR